MDRNQAKEIVMIISRLYPNNFKLEKQEDLVSLIDTWHFALEDHEYDLVKANLKQYVNENQFPPKVKDLTKGLLNEPRSVVPGVEETRSLLDSYEKEITPEQQERINEIRAGIRKKWGLD